MLVVPSVVFDHVRELDNILAFFVLLRTFKCLLVFPSKCCLATFTIDVRHCMKSCEENALLRWSAAHIDHGIEQICSTLTPLKWLWDKFVVIGEMCPTMNAGVSSMTSWQVGLKCFHHSRTAIRWGSGPLKSRLFNWEILSKPKNLKLSFVFRNSYS